MALIETVRALEADADRTALKPGTIAGETAGHRWRIDVAPFVNAAGIASPWEPVMETISVRTARRNDRKHHDRAAAPEAAAMNGRREQSARRSRLHADRSVLAMTLMVGVLAALATVTAQWLPNWNRGFARVQRAELLALGLERLVADLSAAELVTANGRPASRCSTAPNCR